MNGMRKRFILCITFAAAALRPRIKLTLLQLWKRDTALGRIMLSRLQIQRSFKGCS